MINRGPNRRFGEALLRKSSLVELLEGRRYMATYDVVRSADDNDSGSLRWAINMANSTPGHDTIRFNIPTTLRREIILQSALPALQGDMTIDGTTQPGHAGTPVVQVFAGWGNLFITPFVVQGSSVTIRGLSIGGARIGGVGTGSGISVKEGANRCIIEDNHIGVDSTGLLNYGNQSHGVEVRSNDNIVRRNVIGGNGNGVSIYVGARNVIEQNIIGLGVDRATVIPNVRGVLVALAAKDNRIGSQVATGGNIIAGNATEGVQITGTWVTGNSLSYNQIGYTTDAGVQIGNGGAGVRVADRASQTNIGPLGRANIIKNNGAAGVRIENGSYNHVHENNRIFDNAGMAIDVGAAGPTPNDPGDTDNVTNYPLLWSVNGTATTTEITYALVARPGSYLVAFYTADKGDGTERGEMRNLLTTRAVTVPSSGSFSETLTRNIYVPGGYLVAATATRSDFTGLQTSEVSHTVSVASPPAVVQTMFDVVKLQGVRFQTSAAIRADSLQPSDARVVNLTTGQEIPMGTAERSLDGKTLTFRAAGLLPDGNYRATLLPGSVTSTAGFALADTPDATMDFHVLAGDANRDRRVDISDFAILAGRFNQPAAYIHGDFNYDGVANIADFAILASRFNTTLPAPAGRPGTPMSGASNPFSREAIDDPLTGDVLGIRE